VFLILKKTFVFVYWGRKKSPNNNIYLFILKALHTPHNISILFFVDRSSFVSTHMAQKVCHKVIRTLCKLYSLFPLSLFGILLLYGGTIYIIAGVQVLRGVNYNRRGYVYDYEYILYTYRYYCHSFCRVVTPV